MDGVRDPHTMSPTSPVDGQLFAAQAAADLLGIHRSTLYLAVRKLKLIPDAYTPGGHARFRLETLERFRERLALDSATGGEGALSRAVANAVATLSRFTQLQPVCEAVADAALSACPGFETCMIAGRDEHDQHGEPRLLAERGLPQRLRLEYDFLRRRPGLDLITTMVIRQRTPFFCSDVRMPGAAAPEGGLIAMTSAGYRSCAALPCVSDGETLGLLICLGRVPCGLSEPEIVALSNLAHVLTVALRRQRRDEAALRQSAVIGELMRQTQLANRGEVGADELREIRRTFQQGARARLVSEWGIDNDTSDAPAPLSDLLRAAATTDAPQRVEWADDEGWRIGLAIPMQAPGRRAAVGAIWRRRDLRSGMEVALLHVYAQVCSIIASR
ncbi:MAG TPA: GAF domain-containing protein [Ktedonobacterales bacterium]|nr:GAF domain-containing protein [Ktedonobacterales bacterium]